MDETVAKEVVKSKGGAPEETYHIEATESLVERTLRTLKHNDLFAVFDQQGNFDGGPGGPDGLYFKDTRFLSTLKLKLAGTDPLQLGSVVLDDNGALVVDLTNADIHSESGRIWLQRDQLHLSRFKFLSSETSYERIRVHTYGPVGRHVPLQMEFDADFADLFEVRGQRRDLRGEQSSRLLDSERVEFRYKGLDNVVRRTVLHFEPAPTHLTDKIAHWDLELDEQIDQTIVVKICCNIDDERDRTSPIAKAFRSARGGQSKLRSERAQISSSNPQFDAIVARGWSDLDMLSTQTEHGLYPYAGVPWYSTIFGRDGIITAMQMIWCAPYLARGVLATLAHLQATDFDPIADAQPGKILHESRGGEMAGLGEVPFGRYYGSVDATPLFVMLAEQYFRRTGDIDFIRTIWPNIRAALRWIDDYGDIDGDGFVEYARMNEKGLSNQGWKDSSDSIFHADGQLASGPIALSEVQAYVFAAKRGGASLARALRDEVMADQLDTQAETLRQKFEAQFWMEDLGFYALALDGAKRPCRVLSSNAGHCLFAGLASPSRAEKVGLSLVGPTFFSGWGVRTIATNQARYNPMSYHNGSIWPHDNALIALGLSRYGLKAETVKIFQGIFDSATYDEFRRLPELFCGFSRRRRRGPTAYPVACSPQAWAAATPFALIAATLGLEVDHSGGELRFDRPQLPSFLDHLTIRNLRLGDSRIDVALTRTSHDVTTAVLDRKGPAKVIINK